MNLSVLIASIKHEKNVERKTTLRTVIEVTGKSEMFQMKLKHLFICEDHGYFYLLAEN